MRSARVKAGQIPVITQASIGTSISLSKLEANSLTELTSNRSELLGSHEVIISLDLGEEANELINLVLREGRDLSLEKREGQVLGTFRKESCVDLTGSEGHGLCFLGGGVLRGRSSGLGLGLSLGLGLGGISEVSKEGSSDNLVSRAEGSVSDSGLGSSAHEVEGGGDSEDGE